MNMTPLELKRQPILKNNFTEVWHVITSSHFKCDHSLHFDKCIQTHVTITTGKIQNISINPPNILRLLCHQSHSDVECCCKWICFLVLFSSLLTYNILKLNWIFFSFFFIFNFFHFLFWVSFLLWYNSVVCLRLVEGYAGLCFYYYHFWVYRCVIYSFICLLFFIIIKEKIKTLVWLCVYTHTHTHTHTSHSSGHTSEHWLPLAFGNRRQGVGREIFTFNCNLVFWGFFFFGDYALYY